MIEFDNHTIAMLAILALFFAPVLLLSKTVIHTLQWTAIMAAIIYFACLAIITIVALTDWITGVGLLDWIVG